MIQIGASPATIDTPIEHLMACHRRIEQRLDTLTNAAGHVAHDRVKALAAIAKAIHFLDTSGALHTEDEEASLFPRLRPKLSPSDLAFVDALETQHVEAGSIYSELKQLLSELNDAGEASPDLLNLYRDCAERLRSFYQGHIQAEDEILTAMASRSLNESEIAEISQEMRQRRSRTGTPVG